MSRRIEIEITSLNGDVATWRAAGAKLPKGVLQVSLVPGGPVVGSVYRADIEQFMEGIEVLSVMPPKTASPLDPRKERIELIASEKSIPDVTVTYASKGRGARRDGDERGEGRRDGAKRGARPGTRERSSERGPRPERPSGDRPDRPVGERGPRTERPRGDRGSRPGRERSGPPGAPPVTTTYRNAFLATLSPEQLPVAEQLLRGGMPSVRTAVAEQNKNATAQGRPTIDPGTIDRIAEDLLPKTTLAMWKDRAAGALGAGKELRLRDLRAVVTSAKTTSLDDEARAQLKELQGALSARLEILRTQWTERLDAAMASNNVAEALRLVARPPDSSTRVSSETASALIALVSAALTADQDVAVWSELVNLTVETSIRRNVKPLGIPADDAAKALAIKNAGAIPEFAKLLGMKVPPPPPPTRTTRRAPTRRA
ncbi:MAG: hypothetical protein KGL23_08770 [Acidobacteriota bacterium]|nr:hypothetical protein [Acidobacteriota bacterium]MDE3147510.1 hypothetical protein [Acidobacteriota bacterium]